MSPAPSVVEAALRLLFPAGVAVAAEPVRPGAEVTLWPEERRAITGAVPARQAEFAAGRSAARRVLEGLGHPAVPLPMDKDRAAIWPPGIAGSIAHAAGLAVAVARRGSVLGVDLETDAPVEPDLWPLLCTPDELARLTGDIGHLVRRVFAAKEAVFKAQAPDRRAMFGFEAVGVTLAKDRFDAQFRQDVGAFRAGQSVSGRLATVEGVILAGVAW